MSEWIVRILIIAAAVVGIALYHFNAAPVTIVLWKNTVFQAPLALALILFFLGGVISVAAFVVLLRIKIRIQNWKFSRRIDSEKIHQQTIAEGRSQLALGDFAKAQSLLMRVINEDPENIVARIQLAESYQQQGMLTDALQVLDQARVSQKTNPELLLLAAEINRRLGNYTAAHDNAALLLSILPDNRRALEYAAESAAKVDRFDAALEYSKKLLKGLRGEDAEKVQEQIADFELCALQKDLSEDNDALCAALTDLLRRHRDFVPALERLAVLEADRGDLEAATKLFSKAYSIDYNVSHLEEMAARWLTAENPDRGLKSVTMAMQVKNTPRACLLAARLFLVELLLQLEMVEKARAEFDNLTPEVKPGTSLEQSWHILQARLLHKEGFRAEAFDALMTVVELCTSQTPAPNGTGQDLRRRLQRSREKPAKVESEVLLGETTPPLLNY